MMKESDMIELAICILDKLDHDIIRLAVKPRPSGRGIISPRQELIKIWAEIKQLDSSAPDLPEWCYA